MAKRPTIADLANEANVSTATIDRILNGRPNVSAGSVAIVSDAAARIGFPPRGLIRKVKPGNRPVIRFGFVLHKEQQAFYQNFAAELRRAVASRTDIAGQVTILFSPSQTPQDFAQTIAALGPECDVIGSTSVNDRSLTALVQDIRAQGVPVYAMLNDFAQDVRTGYFGMDNIKVGRIAAWALTTQIHTPGKLAVYVGGNRWHGQLLRETGFQSYLRDHAPGFTMADTLVNLETRQLTYEATLDLLERHPDLRGIYVAGGGMEGAIAALREVRPPGKVALVVNELTPESRAALADRYATMVIATPLAELCDTLIDQIIAAENNKAARSPDRHFLEPRLYVPESV